MSDSQKQLLKTMLFYELQNHIAIEMDKLKASGKDTTYLSTIQTYFENRIISLNEDLKK